MAGYLRPEQGVKFTQSYIVQTQLMQFVGRESGCASRAGQGRVPWFHGVL